MPRDGSNIYHRPVGTDGVPNYPIESAKYNANVADVEQDLNLPRPIVAGGTGASSADQALFNLSGEKAAQLVTDWDGMVWVPGSFYAASTATGTAPAAGHAFSGVCYINEPLANPPTNQNVVVEARDLDAALAVTIWLNNTLYQVGDTARDSADNSIWKSTVQQITGAGPLTFAQYRTAVPGTWVAAPAITPTKYTRIKKAGVWGGWLADVAAQAVRYDTAQVLTAGEQTQGRKNIYAAPFDALAYNGMQVNGAMNVNQEHPSSAVASGVVVKYIVDGWTIAKTGTSVLDVAQVTGGPPGIGWAIQLSATTAQASLGSDYVRFATTIEGYRIARLALGSASASPFTVSFWARMFLPGTYRIVALGADGAANSGWLPFTINASMVWQYITVAVPAQTTGTWNSNETTGMAVLFEVASSATPNTVGATGQYAAITGVVVLPGTEVPSSARSAFIMRPYDQELITCKRYWQKSEGFSDAIIWSGATAAGSNYYMRQRFSVRMRTTPTVLLINDNQSNFPVQGTAPDNVSIEGFQVSRAANNTGVGFYSTLWTADARF